MHHELQKMYLDSLSTAQRNRIKNIPLYTGRRRTNNPPKDGLAPHNFGINPNWWENVGQHLRNDPEQSHLVKEFYMYEDPPGFGSNKIQPRAVW